MKWSDFSKYLKAEHLAGKRVTVTIDRVALEETHPRPGQAVSVPVLYFAGKAKGLILTPTNQRALQALFGNDVTACAGKPIALEAVPVRVGGNDRTPIRIFPANGKHA